MLIHGTMQNAARPSLIFAPWDPICKSALRNQFPLTCPCYLQIQKTFSISPSFLATCLCLSPQVWADTPFSTIASTPEEQAICLKTKTIICYPRHNSHSSPQNCNTISGKASSAHFLVTNFQLFFNAKATTPGTMWSWPILPILVCV